MVGREYAQEIRGGKNERMFRGKLFIGSERGMGVLNQAINGHDSRTTLRMPKVTDTRAVSVREPSSNNDKLKLTPQNSASFEKSINEKPKPHESLTVGLSRPEGSAGSLILPGNQV